MIASSRSAASCPDECAWAGLSDAAYRAHDEAIVWLYRVEEMSLCIPKRLVLRVRWQ